MKRLGFATIAVLALATSAMAVDSILYCTCREYNGVGGTGFRTNGAGSAVTNDVGNKDFYGGAIGNPTLPANNPVLYLSPRMPGGQHIRGTTLLAVDRDTSLRPFQIWMSVGDKYANPNGEELVSSVGYDVNSTAVSWSGPIGAAQPVPAANRRGTFTYQSDRMYTLQVDTGSAGAQLMDDVNILAAPLDHRGATVPQDVPDFGTGAVPTTTIANVGLAGNSYRVGQLMVQADGPTTSPGSIGCKNQLPTRYELKFAVGNILMTRVVNPANAGPFTAEDVAFGYAGAVPEQANGAPCGAAPCGSTLGTSSATADAVVEIRFKGDYRGNLTTQPPQGIVNGQDTSAYLAVITAGAGATALEKWLGDFRGNLTTQPPQGVVNGQDTAAYLAEITYFNTLATCP
ncbi:MAG: hypothetical protein U1A27_04735 [Phycisphaerae bacterium]